ncbi:MAG: YkgJ family cysteine cluster protein [Planctomycetes bacterium]|nr:YkgJ family cysteine cluster protein [Planctomycetota bacterium]MCC7172236.1 YkgJ family cysteine cluster protein [Planctomycetota bacterium]
MAKTSPPTKAPWYRDGIRFECTGCGGCCRARNGYEYVYVDPTEARAIARRLGIPLRQFVDEYLIEQHEDAQMHLRFDDGACSMLKDGKCSVYEERPKQCRTWPFWPENMRKKVWDSEIAPSTPGVGRGRLWTKAEIEAMVAEDER